MHDIPYNLSRLKASNFTHLKKDCVVYSDHDI